MAGKVARGGCLLGNFCVTRSAVFNAVERKHQTRHAYRCISDSLLAYRLKISLTTNHALHSVFGAREMVVSLISR